MATQLQAVINRVLKIVNDATDNIRWGDAEWMMHATDAQLEIVGLRPDAYPVNGNITCVAGTKQSIPATGIRLLKVVRNMGAGSTPGRIVRVIDEQVLNDFDPNWHAATASATIKNYVFNPLDPTRFYTNPPATVGTVLEAVWSAAPNPFAAVTDNIAIPDTYVPPMVEFMAARAFMKDASYAGDQNRSVAHMNAFYQMLGLRLQTDLKGSPNVNAGPFSNLVPGAQAA